MARPRFARAVREKSIEDKCRLIAETYGGRLGKVVMLGFPGYPDRQALFPDRGFSFYVEFKRGAEQPTDLQAKWHEILRRCGHRVYVCHSVELFKQILQLELKL